MDIIGVLRDENDYRKNRNYWKYLKAKLKKEGNELVSAANQLKLTTPMVIRHDDAQKMNSY